jgi:hypothetical protein
MAEGRETPSLTIESLARHNALTEQWEIRQFACEYCYRAWWKTVRTLKPVSKCKICRTKYDPLPPEKQFGIAKFQCTCGNTFTSRADATTSCKCYRCGEQVKVKNIISGRRDMQPRGPTNRRHSCSSCYGYDIYNCPNYRPVVHFSTPHDSTGSTRSSLYGDEYTVPGLPPRLDPVEEGGTDSEHSNSDDERS